MNIGILGGTFDPVHRGHIYIGRMALEIFNLDQILFMVARIPPHKQKARLSAAFHRYAMVVLATADEPQMLACQWELNCTGPSYTIDTLERFRSRYPPNQYCFVAGADALKELHLWKDYAKLLREHCFIFVQRRGVEMDLESMQVSGAFRRKIRIVCEKNKQSIQPGTSFLVRSNPPPFSSSEIRRTISSGRPPAPDSLAPGVLPYIQKYRLYE